MYRSKKKKEIKDNSQFPGWSNSIDGGIITARAGKDWGRIRLDGRKSRVQC